MAKRKRLGAPDPSTLYHDNPVTAPLPPRPAPIAGVAGEAATRAALDEMSEALTQARRDGRMILELPLTAIKLDYLVRDRLSAEDEDLQALMASIEARGQQVPIEVTQLDSATDSYGLISGWRRCQALQLLHEKTGAPEFAVVQALLRRPGEASEAYLSMIEENELRVGLSYYERARIVGKAVEQGVFETERAALQGLFHAASRAKRSKIGTFLHIVAALDDALCFPAALTERVGLRLGRAIQRDPVLATRLRSALVKEAPATWEAETALLLRVAEGAKTTAKVLKKGSDTPKSGDQEPNVTVNPRPGLTMKTHADGQVTLSGERVNSALRTRLYEWLKHHG